MKCRLKSSTFGGAWSPLSSAWQRTQIHMTPVYASRPGRALDCADPRAAPLNAVRGRWGGNFGGNLRDPSHYIPRSTSISRLALRSLHRTIISAVFSARAVAPQCGNRCAIRRYRYSGRRVATTLGPLHWRLALQCANWSHLSSAADAICVRRSTLRESDGSVPAASSFKPSGGCKSSAGLYPPP